MGTKSKPANLLSLNLRLEIVRRGGITLGPGKVELLALIEETGSLGKAAKRMGMSYMKAWSLVQSMKPLVETSRGGQSGGGAKLTETGRQTLTLYRKMQRDCRRASKGSWQKLQRLFQG
jgi:molybdate transport system regulatory protein